MFAKRINIALYIKNTIDFIPQFPCGIHCAFLCWKAMCYRFVYFVGDTTPTLAFLGNGYSIISSHLRFDLILSLLFLILVFVSACSAIEKCSKKPHHHDKKEKHILIFLLLLVVGLVQALGLLFAFFLFLLVDILIVRFNLLIRHTLGSHELVVNAASAHIPLPAV